MIPTVLHPQYCWERVPPLWLTGVLISLRYRFCWDSHKNYVFKKPFQFPLFQWESLEQIVCVLAYMSRELHTSLGLVGRRLPFFSSSESRGEGGGVAFCPSIFFWGESSVTGVMGASRGAEPGGVSGIPMKEATGVLGNVPGVT